MWTYLKTGLKIKILKNLPENSAYQNPIFQLLIKSNKVFGPQCEPIKTLGPKLQNLKALLDSAYTWVPFSYTVRDITPKINENLHFLVWNLVVQFYSDS